MLAIHNYFFRIDGYCKLVPTKSNSARKDERIMDAEAKKTALRMIPYGLYVLTAEGEDGKVAASTVNWVTQTAFQPPLVVVGVKADSGAHSIIKQRGTFALNFLGKAL